MTRLRNTFERSTSRRNIERLLQLIENRSMCLTEISQHLHMTREGLRPYIKYLREQRKIYISRWASESVGTLPARRRPYYKAGSRKDAPAPPPMERREIERAYYQRVVADPERYRMAHNNIRRQNARQTLKRRTERMRRMQESGFDPHAILLAGRRIVVGKTPTPDQVAEIIRLRESGATWKEIVAKTGIKQTTARTHYRKAVAESDPE